MSAIVVNYDKIKQRLNQKNRGRGSLYPSRFFMCVSVTIKYEINHYELLFELIRKFQNFKYQPINRFHKSYIEACGRCFFCSHCKYVNGWFSDSMFRIIQSVCFQNNNSKSDEITKSIYALAEVSSWTSKSAQNIFKSFRRFVQFRIDQFICQRLINHN